MAKLIVKDDASSKAASRS